MEKVHKRFDAKELALFKSVLQGGKDEGVFLIDNVELTAQVVHYCVKGVEVPYIRGSIGVGLDLRKRKEYLAHIVFGALHKPDNYFIKFSISVRHMGKTFFLHFCCSLLLLIGGFLNVIFLLIRFMKNPSLKRAQSC